MGGNSQYATNADKSIVINWRLSAVDKCKRIQGFTFL